MVNFSAYLEGEGFVLTVSFVAFFYDWIVIA